MKITLKTSFLFLAASMLFAACQPVEHKELQPPVKILSTLEGTWKLIKATQVDEDAKTKGFPFKELDLTPLFPYSDFILKFDMVNGAPATFTTTPGASPKIIKLLSGNWTVDNADFPKDITLTSGAVTEKVTLGGYPVASATTLKLSVERRDFTTNKLLISYTYEFAKQ